MATITIDYEADGDVELVLVTQMETAPSEYNPDSLSPTDLKEPTKYNIGPLNIHVNRFRLCVSSPKLISSSHYFQAMLEGPAFPEGRELTENGHVIIQLINSEDNPTAMMIVLGILYGSKMQVPDELDFLTLYNIAVLVDKYQWHQLVTPRAIVWFDKLVCSSGFPDRFDETLLSWLWIAWLFGMEDHFKTLSKLVQQVATRSIDLKDVKIRLPIPVIMAINDQRETAFQKAEKVIEDLKNRLLNLEDQKEDLIEDMMLRSLAYGFAVLCSQNLKLGSFAIQDHAGCSIRSLSDDINNYASSTNCTVECKIKSSNRRCVSPGGIWDLKHNLENAIQELDMENWGLEYNEFKPKISKMGADGF